MPYFFNRHPEVQYDMGYTGNSITVHNPLVRFKLKEALKSRSALYYTHNLEDGQSVQFVANEYYDDVTLDWIIYFVNDIVDPQYDLPLNYQDFINFIKGKYGSVEDALNTVHHYEQIIQTQSVLYDGTIVPEKVIEVDATTYAGLAADEKREIDCYEYEQAENEKKRNIKVLHKDYLIQVLDEIEGIFE